MEATCLRALALTVPLALGGCGLPAALPMALSAAGGAVTFAKDVLELDVAWHQATPGKTPIAAALTGALVVPPPSPPLQGEGALDLAHQPIRTMEPVPDP